LFVASALALAGADPAGAKSLRLASAFDPQSMDPHALALLYQTRIAMQIYESLVGRDRDFKLEPALALRGSGRRENLALQAAPRREVPRRRATHGRRRGVLIELLAKRRSVHSSCAGYRRAHRWSVDGRRPADAPDAVLPRRRGDGHHEQAWCVKHGVLLPQDYNAKQETYAVRNANGTGRSCSRDTTPTAAPC